jgi:hypothetical protein
MKVRTAITVEVIVDVPDPSDAEALDYAAYEQMEEDLSENAATWYRHGTWEIIDPAEKAAYTDALNHKTFGHMDTLAYKVAYERSVRDSLELAAREREAGEDMDGHKIGGDE